MSDEDMIEIITYWAELITKQSDPVAAYRIFKDRDKIIDALTMKGSRE